MTLLKWTSLSALLLSATAVCQQQQAPPQPAPAPQAEQQKFPLRPGEWEVSIPIGGPKETPALLRVCLNDELWTKALTQNPACSLQDLKITSKGINYTMDCSTPTAQMKGNVEMFFDGKEHMIARGTTQVTQNGSTAHGTQSLDYRWKNADCKPDDINIQQSKP